MFIIENTDLDEASKEELRAEFKRVLQEAGDLLGELHEEEWVTSSPVFVEALAAVAGRAVGEVMTPPLVLKVAQTFLQTAFVAASEKEDNILQIFRDAILADAPPENDKPC